MNKVLQMYVRINFRVRWPLLASPALYHEKPVSRLMDRDMACAEWGTDAAQLLELAGARPEERMYDSLVITSGGQYAGVLSAKQLLQAIAHNQEQLTQIDACAQRMEERAQAAHAELRRMAERD
ncbi:hypothetical protein [Paenibacillus thiaminolyticus]|uniref:hypothetical protein n=1 Tax=Paenibacillus thiaminolyticus TaxID=49283 RepID=UPI001601B39A|nr:hypothetical protein [Paenibacillus thiaminolyticus]